MNRDWRLAVGAFTFAALMLAVFSNARAIDFYEIQIYPVETDPVGHLQLELHSNTVTTATGSQTREEISPYQIHETLEATYGVLSYLEIGQYLCTAKLDEGRYEYAGARTKVHFGVPMTENWPIQVGANVELAYMRRAAEEHPLTLEMRPIVQTKFRKFTLIGNFAFEKPFNGPGTHKGVQFAPSGQIFFDVSKWFIPAIEYYGDMGALQDMPGAQRQQHFIVPAVNLRLLDQLELNLGVGVGVTHASNALFLKSIVGWTF
ncbi:MAG: hypothetical protein JWM69_672 [Candidatus Binatus sp.]|jgi:hypothetical protein|nr:hypothetical protein [Candidatus Binatus sp.]